MTLDNFLNIFKDRKIVAFGETHHGQHTSFFNKLSNNLDRFNGVFLEMPVSDQPSVNYYLKNGNFDDRLKGLIAGAMGEGKDIESTTKAILDYGKIVPIVCIDSSKKQDDIYKNKSIHGYYFHKGNSRDEDMFKNIVEKYKEGERWVLISGAKHLELGSHHRSHEKTLGTRLKERFGEELFRVCLTTNEDGTKEIDEVACYLDREGGITEASYLSQFDAYIVTPSYLALSPVFS
ncbi:hypothetical protein A3B02_02400 [Candidatus Roizmanbacteria bacterium RIFCSPLOWO2_01_FULL_42_14]|uniref:Haem-binding uptake Tiki superfamily ChaN domain-containing protein n=2 Tax=Candidatus Roizmaniibacteriota TaxID=1752723 RepID=A0A1F7JWA6_9BACT|nr:MAG: hypothetical protein A3B02_02400 [Candidatus Roizmanbacteria bacterium RIFCSPLOWO2_01_FULL_42_14]OGK59892.1 MAG: hypothetical protein A3I56_03445 [Candidatus Roizmanbacteria bacterium RIFCSPLOWO2_02_FULL_43_10]